MHNGKLKSLLAVVVVASAGFAGSTHALAKHESPFACVFSSPLGIDGGGVSNQGPSNTGPNGALYCPIDGDNDLTVMNITQLHVFVGDGTSNGQVTAQNCEGPYNNTFGACGLSASTSTLGTYDTDLQPQLWTGFGNDEGFGYTTVVLPAPQEIPAGNRRLSRLRGIFFNNW